MSRSNRISGSAAPVAMANKPTVMDAADIFLTSRGNYRIIKDGKLLYFDSNHLTLEGAALLVPMFRPLFQAQ